METEGTTQESSTGDAGVVVVAASDRPSSSSSPPPPATATADADHGFIDDGGDVVQRQLKKVVPVVITVDTSAAARDASSSSPSVCDETKHNKNTNTASEENGGDRGDRFDNIDQINKYAVQVEGTRECVGGDPTSRMNTSSSASVPGGTTSHQARTPKHANRTEESKSWEEKEMSSTTASHHPQYHHPGAPYHSNSFPPPHASSSRPSFDHRGGGGSAFHPHDRQHQPYQQQQQRMPIQVSPGAGGRYYQYNHGGPPRFGHPPMPPFDPYGPPHPPHHHPGFRPPPPPPPHYGHGLMYPPPYAEGGNGYEGGGPSWGTPPGYAGRPAATYNGPPPPPPPHGPSQQQHPPPPPPPQQMQQNDYRGGGPQPPPPRNQSQQQTSFPQQQQQQQQQHPPILQANSSGNFSRAVSSSFDRSIKSTGAVNENNKLSKEDAAHSQHHQQFIQHHQHHRHPSNSMDPVVHHTLTGGDEGGPGAGVDNQSSDDASWGQLNQVASVDEDELRKRLSRNTHVHHHSTGGLAGDGNNSRPDTPDEAANEVAVTRSASNSSSLTNSPTEGVKQQIQLHHQHHNYQLHHHSKRLEKDRSSNNKMIQSSLDSLSSVASAQAPMGASNNKKEIVNSATNLSPQGSTNSLDLMKCPSGSSALLLPRHESAHHFSYTLGAAGKRTDEDDDEDDVEERGDEDTKMDASELRKAPSSSEDFKQQQQDRNHSQFHHRHHRRSESDGSGTDILTGRPKKKMRTETNSKDAASSKKSSPLSIECSPPNSPALDKRKGEGNKAKYQQHPPSSLDSYYDKPPQYTYSLESAPPMPLRDSNGGGGRPDSSSSTITPMHVEDSEVGIPPSHHRHLEGPPPLPHYHPHHHQHFQHPLHHHNGGNGRQQPSSSALPPPPPPPLGQIPSWEIHHQDSFGGHSVSGAGGGHGGNGGGIMTSFSFTTQDYPPLTTNPSTEQQQHGRSGPGSSAHHPPLESRNQSFDGGHYHGSFARSDSMISYDHPGSGPPPPPMYDRGGPGGYHGPFPPQAPSWGSAASFPQGHYYQGYPGPVRNYSEDSSGRASPPPTGMRGHLGGHRAGGGFQPPPEFRAPPSMVPKAGPNQTQHILSSPYTPTNSNKGGSYGWSKEEDMRLTDIMKKYKNPRDWEPIAKEHNCGRSAKECHERWIRYLKPGVRKGQWTDHEDAIVMEVVTSSSEQPFTRWSDLAQRLPGRVGKQIRDRWVNHLNPNINHLPFSREDDLLLWDGHKKLGKRWVEISTKYFNSSRSENHIKNRWYSASFKKFIANEFGVEAYSGNKVKKESPKKKNGKDNGKPSSSESPSKRTQPPSDDISQCEEV